MIDTVEKQKVVKRCRSTTRKDNIGSQEDIADANERTPWSYSESFDEIVCIISLYLIVLLQ